MKAHQITEHEESDDTISISTASTTDHLDQFGVPVALKMIAYYYSKLSEAYSQLMMAIQN